MKKRMIIIANRIIFSLQRKFFPLYVKSAGKFKADSRFLIQNLCDVYLAPALLNTSSEKGILTHLSKAGGIPNDEDQS